MPGVTAGSVIRVELLPGPRVFDLVVPAVLVPLGSRLATTRPMSAGDSGRPARPIVAPRYSSWRPSVGYIGRCRRHADPPMGFISMTTRGKTCRRGIAARRAATPPALSQRHPLEILEATDIEPCSLKADKDGRICQRPLGITKVDRLRRFAHRHAAARSPFDDWRPGRCRTRRSVPVT